MILVIVGVLLGKYIGYDIGFERAVEENQDWKTYINQEHNIQFDYPSSWGDLKLISKESDNLYHLEAGNTLIGDILYHALSRRTAFIEKGAKEYELPDSGEKTRQEILKVILPARTIKTIMAVPENPEEGKLILYNTIKDFNFSPSGNYITADVVGWEWLIPYIFETVSGVNLLSDKEEIWYDGSSESVLWADDDKALVIRSYLNDFGGEGLDSVFVSDYGNPKALNQVFTLTQEQHNAGSLIENVSLKGDEVIFDVSIREATEKGDSFVGYTRYQYDIKTKKLRELN